MKRDTKKHHRHSFRLEKYDYSLTGAYFLTICTQGKKCLLGDVVDGEMQLNKCGEVVTECWEWLPKQYPQLILDEWIIMPNHLHGIIVIIDDGRGGSRTAPTNSIKRKPLGSLVGAFKTVSTKQINIIRKTAGKTFWQRNYFERVVRDEKELNNIREYILSNPLGWELDHENPNYKSVENKEKAPWQD